MYKYTMNNEGIVKLEQGISSMLFIVAGIINHKLGAPIHFCFFNIILGFVSFLNHSIQFQYTVNNFVRSRSITKTSPFSIIQQCDIILILINSLIVIFPNKLYTVLVIAIYFSDVSLRNTFKFITFLVIITLCCRHYNSKKGFRSLYLFYNLLAVYLFYINNSDWQQDIRLMWHTCCASILIMNGYIL